MNEVNRVKVCQCASGFCQGEKGRARHINQTHGTVGGCGGRAVTVLNPRVQPREGEGYYVQDGYYFCEDCARYWLEYHGWRVDLERGAEALGKGEIV